MIPQVTPSRPPACPLPISNAPLRKFPRGLFRSQPTKHRHSRKPLRWLQRVEKRPAHLQLLGDYPAERYGYAPGVTASFSNSLMRRGPSKCSRSSSAMRRRIGNKVAKSPGPSCFHMINDPYRTATSRIATQSRELADNLVREESGSKSLTAWSRMSEKSTMVRRSRYCTGSESWSRAAI